MTSSTNTAMSRQNVLDALHALNHHPDSNVKKQASTWLEHWQISLDAWSVSDSILHDASSSLEAQYFCAQTFRTKVRSPARILQALSSS
jgi:transportin-3